jgi:hypothetical protein
VSPRTYTEGLYSGLIKLKPVFVILGWATSFAGFALGAIFQSYLLPNVPGNGGGLLPEVLNASSLGLLIPYLGCFGTSILATVILSDASRALISLFPSYLLGAFLTYLVLVFPALSGAFQPPSVLEESASIFTLSAFFPVLLLVSLAGTLLGALLGDRFS